MITAEGKQLLESMRDNAEGDEEVLGEIADLEDFIEHGLQHDFTPATKRRLLRAMHNAMDRDSVCVAGLVCWLVEVISMLLEEHSVADEHSGKTIAMGLALRQIPWEYVCGNVPNIEDLN